MNQVLPDLPCTCGAAHREFVSVALQCGRQVAAARATEVLFAGRE